MPTSPFAEARRVAAWFHALSDVLRLTIVDLLSHQGHCASELEKRLDVNASRLSFHLRVLKRAGLVRERRNGRWLYYALEPAVLEEVAAHVQMLKPAKRPATCALPCCH